MKSPRFLLAAGLVACLSLGAIVAPAMAAPIEVTVNTVAELIAEVDGATDPATETEISLSPDFFVDAASATATIAVKMPAGAVTVDGQGGTLTSAHLDRLLRITDSGAGQLTFTNLTLDGLDKQPGVNVDTQKGVLTFDSVSVVNSYALDNGAAFLLARYVPGLTLNIFNSTVTNNTQNSAGYTGAGIYSQGLAGSIVIKNSEFSRNRNLALGSVVGGEGGAIFLYQTDAAGSLTVLDSIFDANEAVKDATGSGVTFADGGAVGIFDIVAGTQVLFQGNTFMNNVAGDDGGAIMIQGNGGSAGTTNIPAGQIIFNNNTFYGNLAQGLQGTTDNGGAVQIYANAGTLKALKVNVDFNNNTFVNNEIKGSASKGGAISASASGISPRSVLNLKGNLFVGNKAGDVNSVNVGKPLGTCNDLGGNLGFDCGTVVTYPTVNQVFGTGVPVLSSVSSAITAGVDNTGVPVVAINPTSLALNATSGGTLTVDQRGFSRTVGTYDSGSVEIASVKFVVNAPAGKTGTFVLPELVDGNADEYYFGTTPTEYYMIAQNSTADTTKTIVELPGDLGATIDGWKFTGWALETTVTDPAKLLEPASEQTVPDATVYYAQWENLAAADAGTVGVEGVVEVGETLTAVPAGWPEGTTFEYLWVVGETDDLSLATAVVGAFGETLVVTDDMAGKFVGVVLVGSQVALDGGSGEATAVVGPVPFLDAGTVGVEGVVEVGETLTAVPAGWPEGTTFEFLWVVGETDDLSLATAVVGAFGETLVVTDDMAGKFVGVVLVGSQVALDGGSGEATAVVGPVPFLDAGTVGVEGVVEVGETLTAVPAGWPEGTTFEFLWVVGETDDLSLATAVVGAFGETLVVTDDMAGKFVGVVLVGSQVALDGGSGEATAVVGPVPFLDAGTVGVEGVVEVGETLTAVPAGWPEGTTFEFLWVVGETDDLSLATAVVGAFGETLVVTDDMAGKFVGVVLVGSQVALDGGSGEATAVVGPVPFLDAGTVGVEGVVEVGETLTAVPAGWPEGTTFEFLWVVGETDDLSLATAVVGAFGETLVVTDDMAGKFVGVVLVGSQVALDGGSGEATAVVGPVPFLDAGTVGVEGVVEVGETLTAVPAGWPEGTTFEFLWVVGETDDLSLATAVVGAFGETLVVTDDMAGKFVGVVLVGSQVALDGGSGEATAVVGPVPFLDAGTVGVEGVVEVGETLTAVPAGWPEGTTFEFLWVVGETDDLSLATAVVGAFGETLVVTDDMAGKFVGVVLVGSQVALDGGNGEATAVVGPVPSKELPAAVPGTVTIAGKTERACLLVCVWGWSHCWL